MSRPTPPAEALVRAPERGLGLGWRALRWASTLLVVAALALAALMLVPLVASSDRYVITGSSMEPTIPRGALLYAERVPVSELRVGDVITYQPPPGSGPDGVPVTHRIVWRGRDEEGRAAFKTKGDNNRRADPWRFRLDKAEQARYAFHIPYVGYAFAALSIRWVRMVVIGVPALLIALATAVGLWRDAGRRRAQARRAQPQGFSIIRQDP